MKTLKENKCKLSQIKIDKLNKKIKILEDKNSRYVSFLMEFDNLWGIFNEWEEENYGND